MHSFLVNDLDRLVKEELEKETIPKGAKLAIIATVDNRGNKIIVAADITERLQIKSIFAHDWDGDNSATAKIIYTR